MDSSRITEGIARELPDSRMNRKSLFPCWLTGWPRARANPFERAKFARVCNSESQDALSSWRSLPGFQGERWLRPVGNLIFPATSRSLIASIRYAMGKRLRKRYIAAA
jgi:hypothetical protein